MNLDDDLTTEEILPFDFLFYDQNFSSVYVSANGWLSFTNDDPYDWNNVNYPLMSPSYGYSIAVFWDDLKPMDNITVKSFNNCWIVTWTDVSTYNDYYVGTFQILLFSSGEIKMQYQNINYTDGGYTTGINLGDGELGMMYKLITNTTTELALIYAIDFDKQPLQPTITSNSASPTIYNRIELEWEPSAFADNYSLYRTSVNIDIVDDLELFTPIYSGLQIEFQDHVSVSGIYYYIIIAENTFGKSIITTESLEIEVDLTLSSQFIIILLSANYVTEQITVNWNPIINAQNYTIYVDDVIIDVNNPSVADYVTTNNTFVYDYYVNKTYYFALFASNIHGDSPLSSCWSVNISSNSNEEENLPPLISHPADIRIALNNLPYVLSWTVSDNTSIDMIYEIYINGTLNVTGTWINNNPIQYTITSLNVGTYEIEIRVFDGENPSVNDTVTVEIYDGSSNNPDNGTDPKGSDLPLIIGISGGIVILGGTGFMFIKKKVKKK